MKPTRAGFTTTTTVRSFYETDLSPKDTEVDKAIGLGVGADDYVTKPFCWRDLAVRIRAVLR